METEPSKGILLDGKFYEAVEVPGISAHSCKNCDLQESCDVFGGLQFPCANGFGTEEKLYIYKYSRSLTEKINNKG